jgi:hypothetical protein
MDTSDSFDEYLVSEIHTAHEVVFDAMIHTCLLMYIMYIYMMLGVPLLYLTPPPPPPEISPMHVCHARW